MITENDVTIISDMIDSSLSYQKIAGLAGVSFEIVVAVDKLISKSHGRIAQEINNDRLLR